MMYLAPEEIFDNMDRFGLYFERIRMSKKWLLSCRNIHIRCTR